MASASQTEFSAEEFNQALRALDLEFGKSKNMSKIAPIQLQSAGGFVAITLFHNHLSTQDKDYIVVPDTPNVNKIKEKLQNAVESVSRQRSLSADWINLQMDIFAISDLRGD